MSDFSHLSLNKLWVNELNDNFLPENVCSREQPIIGDPTLFVTPLDSHIEEQPFEGLDQNCHINCHTNFGESSHLAQFGHLFGTDDIDIGSEQTVENSTPPQSPQQIINYNSNESQSKPENSGESSLPSTSGAASETRSTSRTKANATSGRKRGRPSKNRTEEEQREATRITNKNSAKRYRLKKKLSFNASNSGSESFESQNDELKTKISKLENEIAIRKRLYADRAKVSVEFVENLVQIHMNAIN